MDPLTQYYVGLIALMVLGLFSVCAFSALVND